MIVGFIGLAVLVLPGDRPDGAPLWGVLLIVLAAILWASGSFYSKRMTLPEGPARVDRLADADGRRRRWSSVGLVAGEASDLDPSEFSTDSLLALAYLITFGSMLAYTAYTWLLGNAPISTVTTYAYVNPVIALALGAAILSEEIDRDACWWARRRSSPPWRRWCARRRRPATPARTRRRWWRRASPSG